MVRQAWLIAVAGIFLIGCVFLLVGCSGDTGTQPAGSQNREGSQSEQTGAERTGYRASESTAALSGQGGSREDESTHEATEPGGTQASEGGESTHEGAQHGKSVEAIPPNTLTDSLLKVNGITYDAAAYSTGGALHEEDLGPKVAEVSPEMNKERTNPTTTYNALPNELPVYTIKGYDPSFRVAVRMDDDLRAFEVLYNPKAKEGSDILDIGGKVRVISISHDVARGAPPPPVGTIDNPNKVERLLQSLMGAPIKPTSPDYYGIENLDQYVIGFTLKDATFERFEYRMDTGRLSKVPESGPDIPTSGIVVPQAFREAIEEGVEKPYQREIELEKAERRSCSDTRRSHEVRRVNEEGDPLTPHAEAYTTNDVDPRGPWGGVLRGTGEKDKLLGEAGEDEIYGLGGDDTVDGGACGDKIYGGPGGDNLVGDQKEDVDYGGVQVKSGKDVLYGGDGDDTLSPDKDGQRDELYCGKGNDVVEIRYSADKIDYVDDSCEEVQQAFSAPA